MGMRSVLTKNFTTIICSYHSCGQFEVKYIPYGIFSDVYEVGMKNNHDIDIITTMSAVKDIWREFQPSVIISCWKNTRLTNGQVDCTLNNTCTNKDNVLSVMETKMPSHAPM